MDVEKATITVMLRQGRGEEGDAEKSYVVAKDAEIAVEDGLGRRTSVKEGKLVELATGCYVILRLSADQKTIESVFVEGPMLNGNVKSVDAAKNSVTVVVGAARGEVGIALKSASSLSQTTPASRQPVVVSRSSRS